MLPSVTSKKVNTNTKAISTSNKKRRNNERNDLKCPKCRMKINSLKILKAQLVLCCSDETNFEIIYFSDFRKADAKK